MVNNNEKAINNNTKQTSISINKDEKFGDLEFLKKKFLKKNENPIKTNFLNFTNPTNNQSKQNTTNQKQKSNEKSSNIAFNNKLNDTNKKDEKSSATNTTNTTAINNKDSNNKDINGIQQHQRTNSKYDEQASSKPKIVYTNTTASSKNKKLEINTKPQKEMNSNQNTKSVTTPKGNNTMIISGKKHNSKATKCFKTNLH